MIKYSKMMAMRTGKIINEIFDNQLFFLIFYFIYFLNNYEFTSNYMYICFHQLGLNGLLAKYEHYAEEKN